MKRLVLVVTILIFVSGFGYFVFQNQKSTPSLPHPTLTPTQITSITQNNFCVLSQLQASIQPNGAAGNIYAKLTLKNISKVPCSVVGNNTIKVDYPISVKNFQMAIKRQPTTSLFTLQPNQTIFSLLHFPNGPQCSGPTIGVDAGVSYNISQKDSISFQPSTGPTVVIPSCEKTTEMTIIDVYPFSDKEVLP